MNLSEKAHDIESKVGIKHHVNDKLKMDFYEYACSHQTIGNKWTHAFGIPAIIVSALGALSFLRMGPYLNGGIIFWGAIIIWLLTLDVKLTIPFAAASFAGLILGEQMSLTGLFILFIFGWVLQLFGHSHYEKKKPSFLTSIRHMVIGPVWLLSRLLKL